jgi:hypothetical protein
MELMGMRPTKLIMMKGMTVETAHPKGDKWKKTEITVEVELTDGDNLELTKTYLDTILDSWLQKEA